MNRKLATTVITVTWESLDAAIERLGGSLANHWRELNDVCIAQEKRHRGGLGGSFRQHHPKAVPATVAAHYFAAMACCRDIPEIRTWWTAVDIRRDWALGYAINEALSDVRAWRGIVQAVAARDVMIHAIDTIDYAKDLV